MMSAAIPTHQGRYRKNEKVCLTRQKLLHTVHGMQYINNRSLSASKRIEKGKYATPRAIEIQEGREET